MKALVTYESSSGNTKKIARAIFDSLDCQKEIVPMGEVHSLDPYDLVFVGLPVIRAGAPGKVRRFLRSKADGKKVALFVTHAMPSNLEWFGPVLPDCLKAASGAEVVGMFDCQGRMAGWVEPFLRIHPYGYVRRWAKMNGEGHGAGHPDEADLAGAAEFGHAMAAKVQAGAG